MISSRLAMGAHSSSAHPTPWPRPAALKYALVLLLTGAAGYVDAFSYLALGRVFTANMTGNTVLFGLALVQADGGAIVRTALALGAFVAGTAIGAWLVHW